MSPDKRCIDNMTTREDAIDHVVSSAGYWEGDNLHSDASFNCPSNLGKTKAFEEAVDHVNYYHYRLSKKDIRIAWKRYTDGDEENGVCK